jgi:transketolase
MLDTATRASDALAKDGLAVCVLSMHTVKPLDTDAVIASAWRTRRIVTLEEHSVLGGLGGAVAEVLCEAGIPGIHFHRIGLPSHFNTAVGDQEYLRRMSGLDADSVTNSIRQFCRGNPTVGQHAFQSLRLCG